MQFVLKLTVLCFLFCSPCRLAGSQLVWSPCWTWPRFISRRRRRPYWITSSAWRYDTVRERFYSRLRPGAVSWFGAHAFNESSRSRTKGTIEVCFVGCFEDNSLSDGLCTWISRVGLWIASRECALSLPVQYHPWNCIHFAYRTTDESDVSMLSTRADSIYFVNRRENFSRSYLLGNLMTIWNFQYFSWFFFQMGRMFWPISTRPSIVLFCILFRPEVTILVQSLIDNFSMF